jgi:hypothetical protein
MSESLVLDTTETSSPVDPQVRIDQLEQAMLSTGSVIDLPLIHRFLDGLYVREIHMPAGTLATSKIHKTEHPFVILRGRVSVYVPGEDHVEHLTGPHFGITRPGTRRVLYMHEDTVWITFHRNPTTTTDLAKIEADIIEQRLLEDGFTAFEEYRRLMAILGIEHNELRIEGLTS